MSPRQILEIDTEAGNLPGPGISGKLVWYYVMQFNMLVILGTRKNFQLKYKDLLTNWILNRLNVFVDDENKMINELPCSFDMADTPTVVPVVGSRLSFCWHLEHKHFVNTVIAINYDKLVGMYDDNDMETLN